MADIKPVSFSFNFNKADLEQVQTLAVNALVEGLNGLVVGEADDLRQYAVAIVQDVVQAAAAGDQDTLAQLDDQRKVLQETSRIRFVRGLEATAAKVANAILTYTARLLVPTA